MTPRSPITPNRLHFLLNYFHPTTVTNFHLTLLFRPGGFSSLKKLNFFWKLRPVSHFVYVPHGCPVRCGVSILSWVYFQQPLKPSQAPSWWPLLPPLAFTESPSGSSPHPPAWPLSAIPVVWSHRRESTLNSQEFKIDGSRETLSCIQDLTGNNGGLLGGAHTNHFPASRIQ